MNGDPHGRHLPSRGDNDENQPRPVLHQRHRPGALGALLRAGRGHGKTERQGRDRHRHRPPALSCRQSAGPPAQQRRIPGRSAGSASAASRLHFETDGCCRERNMPTTREFRIAIIGAGPAGIAAGHELLAGFLRVYDLRGTGCAGRHLAPALLPGTGLRRVGAFLLVFLRPNPDWSASFVGLPEIQAYLARCATCVRAGSAHPPEYLHPQCALPGRQGHWTLVATGRVRSSSSTR